MNRVQYFFSLVLCFITTSSLAAISPQKVAPRVLIAPTAVVGGMAGTGFSLLNLKSEFSAIAKTERLIIDVGDLQGKPHFGPPSYYHAQLMKDPARLVIDFSQMPLSILTEKQIQGRFKGSHFVRHVQLSMDPEDKTLSMILDLKPETKVRVMQVQGVKTTSKVVVDFL